jgi:hypothetical protein
MPARHHGFRATRSVLARRGCDKPGCAATSAHRRVTRFARSVTLRCASTIVSRKPTSLKSRRQQARGAPAAGSRRSREASSRECAELPSRMLEKIAAALEVEEMLKEQPAAATRVAS